MQERKLNLGIAQFPYGGNGATSSTVPDVPMWIAGVIMEARADPRIGNIETSEFSDTPITMTRNQAVIWARRNDIDVLIMVDSDMRPDSELGVDPEAKPFFKTSFDFIHKHWDKGPHVVCAPYCGNTAGGEPVFVFKWVSWDTESDENCWKLEMYEREDAARMHGIQPCAAQPTGCIMFDMRAFELTEPAFGDENSWFYYEYTDRYQYEKCSTEDVTATRDISMTGIEILGYNPVFCNWDAWAGHWKPKLVRKPRPLYADKISEKYRRAVKRGEEASARLAWIGDKHDSSRPDRFLVDEPPIEYDRCKTLGGRDVMLVGAQTTHLNDLQVLSRLAWKATRAVDAPRLLEVGSWVGLSALTLYEGTGESEHCKVFCVDTWQGSNTDTTSLLAMRAGGDKVYEAFCENVGHLLGRHILPLRGTSLAWARRWDDEPLDLVFIDADHCYDAVKEDIQAWLPHVRDGGILCGHDYCSEFPDVMRAVHELFGDAADSDMNVWHVTVTEELRNDVLARAQQPRQNGSPLPGADGADEQGCEDAAGDAGTVRSDRQAVRRA